MEELKNWKKEAELKLKAQETMSDHERHTGELVDIAMNEERINVDLNENSSDEQV